MAKRGGQQVRYHVPPETSTARVSTVELQAALRAWEEVRCQEHSHQKDMIHDRADSLLRFYCALGKVGWFDQDGLRYCPLRDGSFSRLRAELCRRRR